MKEWLGRLFIFIISENIELFGDALESESWQMIIE